MGPKSLPFLDVQVDVNGAGSALFSIFRKPTNTGLTLNFNAFCPLVWKRALIKCFLRRALKLCSNWNLFHIEVDNLRNVFKQNGYCYNFFDRTVQNFLSSYLCPSDNQAQQPIDQFTLILPYFGVASETLKGQLRRLCKRYNIGCRVVFQPFKVSNYFSLKTRVPVLLKSCLVYKYVCSIESKHCYIGKTKRHFLTRIREHATTNSAIKMHCESCPCFNEQNFSILRACKTDYEATLAEALIIRNRQPTLNNTLVSSGQSTILKL